MSSKKLITTCLKEVKNLENFKDMKRNFYKSTILKKDMKIAEDRNKKILKKFKKKTKNSPQKKT